MGATLKHLVLSGLGGILLACGGWLLWWLGSLILGQSIWEQLPTVWLALVVGGGSAAIAGGCLSFFLRRTNRRLQQQLAHAEKELHTRTKQQESKIAAHPAKRKRRRHPLLQHPLRARVSATLRWQKMSKDLQRLLHLSTAHLLDKPIYRFLHPEDAPAVDKVLQEARTTRRVRQVVCRFLAAESATAERSPDKEVLQTDTKLLPSLQPQACVHVRLALWAKLDGAGKVQYYDCQFVDLSGELVAKEQELHTARKLMARAKKRMRMISRDLARLKLSYQELYHNAPVMYFSINTQGDLVTFNDTLLRALGYDRKELQGRNFADLLSPASLKSQATLAQSLPGQEGEFETQWRKKDGALLDVWIHTVPVYDDQGRFARYRSAALDLSEKNRLANELRARGDELELMNQRLRLINTELEDFTHVVSHDLKEPLRTLQAYSHILAEEHAAQLGPDGFQYINHLIRASRRLGVLIDELLHLSQAGRVTRAPEAFNLIEIVATVRQDLVDLIQRKQATLATEGSLPDLNGDPVRITQLLTNLVANGLKYNRTPAPRVVIGAMPCADDPTRVTIFVRDNGIGIDPAFHQQIFGIFRRLHQANEYEGTGAGLAICKKIVEGHGGRIWVDSQPEQGATFYFTLPRPAAGKAPSARNGVLSWTEERKTDASPSSSTLRKSIPVSDESNGRAASPRIILVEDQPEVGMIIQKLGKRDGLLITWFPTAEDAWHYLQHEPADLLLLDINLPGMSGVQLCQRLRTLPHLKETPVAIFTPEQEPEQLQTLRDAGADFFLTKDLLCQPTVWQQKMQELIEYIRQPLAH